MSDIPITVPMVLWTALGAFSNWLLQNYGKKPEQSVSAFVDDLLANFGPKLMLTIFVYVALGTALSLGFVTPSNSRQAIAGGLAWTSLLGGVLTAALKKQKNA